MDALWTAYRTSDVNTLPAEALKSIGCQWRPVCPAARISVHHNGRVAVGPWDAKGAWGLAPSHYEWLAITIAQGTVSGNWDGAITGRPDARRFTVLSQAALNVARLLPGG